MKPSEDIKPVTYMKTRSAELIKRVTQKGRPIVITQNGEAKVVVQDIRAFERDREALLMLKLLSQGIRDAEEGHVILQESLFNRLAEKLSKI